MVVGCVGWITFDLVNIQLSLVRCERTERIMVLIISMESVKQSVSVQEIGDKREVQYVLVPWLTRPGLQEGTTEMLTKLSYSSLKTESFIYCNNFT